MYKIYGKYHLLLLLLLLFAHSITLLQSNTDVYQASPVRTERESMIPSPTSVIYNLILLFAVGLSQEEN